MDRGRDLVFETYGVREDPILDGGTPELVGVGPCGLDSAVPIDMDSSGIGLGGEEIDEEIEAGGFVTPEGDLEPGGGDSAESDG